MRHYRVGIWLMLAITAALFLPIGGQPVLAWWGHLGVWLVWRGGW